MVVYKDKTKLLYRLTHGSFQVFLYDFFFSFVYFILYNKKTLLLRSHHHLVCGKMVFIVGVVLLLS